MYLNLRRRRRVNGCRAGLNSLHPVEEGFLLTGDAIRSKEVVPRPLGDPNFFFVTIRGRGGDIYCVTESGCRIHFDIILNRIE